MAMQRREVSKQRSPKRGQHFRRHVRVGPTLERLEERAVPASLVTLAYNDVTAAPAVTKAFLTDLYEDTLFRSPDPSELTSVSSDLASGKLTAGAIFANLVGSSEFGNLVNPVLTMYQAYLGRPADLGGFSSWVKLERQGTTLTQIAAGIAHSPEFQARNGDVFALSDSNFVSFLYQDLYQRAPDDFGRTAWGALLGSHQLQRGDLLVSFLQKPEFTASHPDGTAQAVVNAAYLGLWNQDPDNRFDSYVTGLATGTISDPTALATQFINSPEYQAVGAARNYVLGLYEGVLNREPDSFGYRAWRGLLLDQGMSDAQIYAAFLKSGEFQSVDQPVELTYEVYLGRPADGAGLSNWMQAQRNGTSMEQVASGIAS
jgi:hypothetical protein